MLHATMEETHKRIQMKDILAFDGDGVLIDYKSGYRKIWKMCFGEDLTVKKPSYHATTHFGVQNPDKKSHFWKLFHHHGWQIMEPEPGAVEACQELHDAGFEIVCVTAMPSQYQEHRLKNLRRLGFPIEKVIATGTAKTYNPKKEAIDELKPLFFVDDDAYKLKDLSCSTILIEPHFHDSPNQGHDISFVTHVADNVVQSKDIILESLRFTPSPRM